MYMLFENVGEAAFSRQRNYLNRISSLTFVKKRFFNKKIVDNDGLQCRTPFS